MEKRDSLATVTELEKVFDDCVLFANMQVNFLLNPKQGKDASKQLLLCLDVSLASIRSLQNTSKDESFFWRKVTNEYTRQVSLLDFVIQKLSSTRQIFEKDEFLLLLSALVNRSFISEESKERLSVLRDLKIKISN